MTHSHQYHQTTYFETNDVGSGKLVQFAIRTKQGNICVASHGVARKEHGEECNLCGNMHHRGETAMRHRGRLGAYFRINESPIVVVIPSLDVLWCFSPPRHIRA